MRNDLLSSKRLCRLLLIFVLIAPLSNVQGQYAFSTKNKYGNSGSSYAVQNKSSLLSVLKELNRVKGVYFLYTQQCIADKMVNPVENTKEDIEKILNELLKNTGLKYKKISKDTYVIVAEDEKDKTRAELKEQLHFAIPVVQTADPVKGKVTSADGVALGGVSISVKGTQRGTTTNDKGEFTLNVNKGETLLISYVGYQSQEYIINDEQSIIVSLVPSAGQISEVVVTALGVRREKRSLGYAVTEVKGSDLTQAREINVGNSLVGRVPGLNVNSVAGGPGASTNIIIRGISSLGNTNQPLYVINECRLKIHLKDKQVHNMIMVSTGVMP